MAELHGSQMGGYLTTDDPPSKSPSMNRARQRGFPRRLCVGVGMFVVPWENYRIILVGLSPCWVWWFLPIYMTKIKKILELINQPPIFFWWEQKILLQFFSAIHRKGVEILSCKLSFVTTPNPTFISSVVLEKFALEFASTYPTVV